MHLSCCQIVEVKCSRVKSKSVLVTGIGDQPWDLTVCVIFTDQELSKNVIFIEFEPFCKNLRAFMSNFGLFYQMMTSPNKWSSHATQVANFKTF